MSKGIIRSANSSGSKAVTKLINGNDGMGAKWFTCTYTYLSEGIFLRSFRSRPQQSKRPFRRVPSVPLHYPPLSAYFQLSPFFLTAAGRLPLQTCHLQAFCGLLAAILEAHFALLVSIPGPSDPPVVPQQSACCQVFPFFPPPR